MQTISKEEAMRRMQQNQSASPAQAQPNASSRGFDLSQTSPESYRRSKPSGALWSIVKSVAKPFVKLGVTGLSAVESTGRLLGGDVDGANKRIKEGYNVPGFGQMAPAKIGTDIEEQQKGKGAFGRNTLETIGTGAEIASTLIGGGEGKAATTVAKKLTTEGLETVAKQVTKKTVGQVVKKGVVEGVTSGALQGFGVAAQEEGAGIGDILSETGMGALSGGVLGGALPISGFTLSKASQLLKGRTDMGGRIINSLIKPLKKDFAYGKNPGRAVAAEGITASSLEELADKVSTRRKEIGQQLQEKALSAGDKKLDISASISPLDEAIAEAKKNPRTNAALIERLENTKADILGEKEIIEMVPDTFSGTGQMKEVRRNVPNTKLSELSPVEAVDFKRRIGDMTKWTGNKSDDEAVNKALKQIYGKVKEKINDAVPGIRELNERYADLTSAEVAARYRDVIEARQALLKMDKKTAAIAGGILGIFSGGFGAAIGAASAVALESALESPVVKTRAAAWLSRSTPAEREIIYKQYPMLRNAIIKVMNPEKDEERSTTVPKKTITKEEAMRRMAGQ